MRPSEIRVGDAFGRLSTLGPSPVSDRRYRWICECDCGATKAIRADSLCIGDIVSCGCFQKEQARRIGKRCATHGLGHSPEMSSYYAMMHRCYTETHKAFRNYGGRGITVCGRWRNNPDVFVADMGPRPSKQHSIERLDNDKGYSPENCIWALRGQQNRNSRRNVWLTIGERTMVLMDWAIECGVDYDTLANRLKRGWPPHLAIDPRNYLRGKRRFGNAHKQSGN